MTFAASSSAVASASDDATLSFYADNAPVYAASGPGGVSRHLDAFLQQLAPGARILDLGCGGGRDSEEMLARGFDVDATDGVVEIARKAEQRIGRPVRVMRFDELDAIGEYDAIWASASLLHVPRPALSQILSLIFHALKSGGLHLASYKGGEAESRDEHGRYFSYLTATEVRSVYEHSAAWTVREISEYVGGGFAGGRGPWVAVTVHKAT